MAAEDLLEKWLLASGGSCLALIHHRSPIRSSSNTSQGCPQEPPHPFFPCLVGWAELGTECPGWSGLPSGGRVRGSGRAPVGAKYNLGWRLSWAGMRE